METTFEIFNLTDNGTIPNSKYPLIVYHKAVTWKENRLLIS
ncbi:MAG TPA: hypothetical protein VKB19_08145 [Pedobacter sp.]|nr:hypothetical protein [Pedobacter sp.]